jgi:predicted regulator of Ras-like GTPase activity (Roadblock/LC7/MglB family)
MTKKEDLEKALAGLNQAGGVEATAIVSRDGLLMASNIPQGVQAETFAAMSATMLGAAETAVNELKKGIVERVIAESKEAKIITVGAGPNALLVTMTGAGATLGLVLVEMEKASEKVKELL